MLSEALDQTVQLKTVLISHNVMEPFLSVFAGFNQLGYTRYVW